MINKYKLNKKKVITAISMLCGFLIISTSFIQPITARSLNKGNLNNSSNSNIEEFLNNLINKEELRELIKKILMNRGVSKNLQAFSKNLENDENFLFYIELLEGAYQDKVNSLLESGKSDSEQNNQQYPNLIENDNLMIQSDLFDFSLKKVKNINREINFLFFNNKEHKILGNLLVTLFKLVNNKLFNLKEDKSIIKANEEKEIVLYNADDKIFKGTHICVSGYLLLLEYLLIDVQSEINQKDSPIDEQCQLLGEFVNFASDDEVKKMCNTIQYNEGLVSAIKQNLSIRINELNLLSDEEKLEKLDNLTKIAQQYEKYYEFEELIQDKYPLIFENALLINTILRIIGIYFILYGICVFGSGVIGSMLNLFILIVKGPAWFWAYFPTGIYLLIGGILFFVFGGVLTFLTYL